MRWFKNLPIRQQLILGFGIVICLLAFVSFMAYLALMEADRSQKLLYDRYFGNVHDLGTLRTHLNGERLDVGTLLELPPSEREPWQQDLQERSLANNEMIQRLLVRLRNDGPAFAKLGELKKIRESFEQTRDTQVIPLLAAGNIEEAKKLFMGVNLARYITMRDIARDLEKNEANDARRLVEETQRQSHRYVVSSIVLGITAVLLTLGLAVFLHRIVMDYIVLRRKAEQGLHIASLYARSLIEASLDPLVTISPEGRITDVNQATEEVTGLARDELIGSDFTAYFTEPEQARRGYRQVLAQGQVRDYPLSIRHVTGRITDVVYNASLFRNEAGEVQGVFAAARDITERKRAEEQLVKYRDHLEELVRLRTTEIETVNKELEAFAYSVSHDLRVPLRAVDGFSRILLEDYQGTLDAEGQRLLNVVRDNAQKMGRLIDDILAFSRMGRKEMRFSEVDLEVLSREAFDELQPQAQERDLRLDVHPLPIARGDPSLLRQVIINLIGNAIKFTRPRSKARIEVGAQADERETVYYVKDNGAGFDMQYADKLFGVFQRLHGGGEFEGTGIGLAIVKRVIERHGGRVWAEGKVGEGATIFFALPITRETT
ncbi:MAG: ATP-binding protein [Methylococcaceae bacterium]|nr:ATP-binding protein [Methylococcaceae bacterium]